MSLREKWSEYRLKEVQELDRKANVTSFWEARLREAYYAGAEAVIELPDKSSHFEDLAEIRAEIDHFRSKP